MCYYYRRLHTQRKENKNSFSVCAKQTKSDEQHVVYWCTFTSFQLFDFVFFFWCSSSTFLLRSFYTQFLLTLCHECCFSRHLSPQFIIWICVWMASAIDGGDDDDHLTEIHFDIFGGVLCILSTRTWQFDKRLQNESSIRRTIIFRFFFFFYSLNFNRVSDEIPMSEGCVWIVRDWFINTVKGQKYKNIVLRTIISDGTQRK